MIHDARFTGRTVSSPRIVHGGQTCIGGYGEKGGPDASPGQEERVFRISFPGILERRDATSPRAAETTGDPVHLSADAEQMHGSARTSSRAIRVAV